MVSQRCRLRGFVAFAFAGIAISAPEVPAKKELPTTLASLLALNEKQLAEVDIAGMFLAAEQGQSYNGKTIDMDVGMAEIVKKADLYEWFFAADGDGGSADRDKLLRLWHELKLDPPKTPLPDAVIFVSIARRLGFPIGIAYTTKGPTVCLQSPEQDTFIDLGAQEPTFFVIDGEPPRAKPSIEQVGVKPRDAPRLKHWILSPKDELAWAIGSRGDYYSGILRQFLDDGTLVVETPSGVKNFKQQEWRDLNKKALVAYLQAQLLGSRVKYESRIESAARVCIEGWRGALEVGSDWMGMPVKADKPFDDKTPAIRKLPYEKLLEMTPEQIAKQDIAEMNLACADGLPGSENINVPEMLATINDWAQLVNFQIKRNHAAFDNSPANFGFSEARYKAYILVMTLQGDIGIHYSPSVAEQSDEKTLAKKYPGIPMGRGVLEFAMAESKSALNSKNKFISGVFGPTKIGTCSSMPVIYAAVGRRLGFPIKIVTTKGHAFARWDEPKEKFNIEGTNGFVIHDDEYYTQWPLLTTPFDIEDGGYLKSLTPTEELAYFLKTRAAVLDQNGRVFEALLATAQANLLRPKLEATRIHLDYLARRYFDRPRIVANETKLSSTTEPPTPRSPNSPHDP